MEPVSEESDMVRFYLTRLDLSIPSTPVWLPNVNIPGEPVYYSAQTGKLVTLELRQTAIAATTKDECAAHRSYRKIAFDEEAQECQWREFRLVQSEVRGDIATLLHEKHIGDFREIGAWSPTDDAAFLHIPAYGTADYFTGEYRSHLARLVAFSLDDAAMFERIGNWELPDKDKIGVNGKRAFVTFSRPLGMMVFDGDVSDTHPILSEQLLNEHFGDRHDVIFDNDIIISAAGSYGAQLISLQ